MVEHEAGNAGPSPLGVNEDKRDVGLIERYVGHHERKPNHQLPLYTTVHKQV